MRQAASIARRVLTSHTGGFEAVRGFSAQLVVVALNIATGILTARSLGPTGRGVFAAATLWPLALTGVFSLGLPAAIVYHLRGTREAKEGVFAASLILSLLLSSLAVIVGAIMVPVLMKDYDISQILLSELGVLMTVPFFVFSQLRQVAVALNVYRIYNLSSCLPPVVYLTMLLIVSSVCGLSPQNCTISLYCSWIIVGVWTYDRLRRACSPSRCQLGFWVRSIAAYSLRGATGDVLAGISGYIDRLVLVFVISPESLGLYAVAYSLSRLMNLILSIINTIFFSKLIGRPTSEIIELHSQIFTLVLHLVLASAVLALLFGRLGLMLFYGYSFEVAQPVFVILTVEAGLTCLGQVTLQTFFALDKPGYVSVAQTISFIAVVSGMLLFAPSFGAIGAAASMAFGAFVRMIVLLVGLLMRYDASLPRLYPTQKDVEYFRKLFQF